MSRGNPRKRLREKAIERAGGRCEFPACRTPRPRLEMAHLRGSGAGGSRYRDDLENVAMLCTEHHDWLDGRLSPNMRRFDNEAVLRAALDRFFTEPDPLGPKR